MVPLVIGVLARTRGIACHADVISASVRRTLVEIRDQYPNLQPVVVIRDDSPAGLLVAHEAGAVGLRTLVPGFSGTTAEWETLLTEHSMILLVLESGDAIGTPGASSSARNASDPWLASRIQTLVCRITCADAGPIGDTVEKRTTGAVEWFTGGVALRTVGGCPEIGGFRRLESFHADCCSLDATTTDDTTSIGWAARQLLPGQAGADFDIVDRIAIHYQRRFGAMLLATHLLAMLMGVVFLIYSVQLTQDWLLLVLIGLFLCGLALWNMAHRGDWHRKRLEYRMLAEILRIMKVWETAGMPRHGDDSLAYENLLHIQDNDVTWIRYVTRTRLLAWHFEPVDAPFAPQACMDWIGDENQGQVGYYYDRIQRCKRRIRITEQLTLVCGGTGMLLVTALLAWPITATQAKPWAVLMVFVAGLVAATREAFARKRGDRELYKQYRLMYQLFSDARHALSTESAPEAQQRIMRALGNAALLEHAEWLLLHRERPIEVSRI